MANSQTTYELHPCKAMCSARPLSCTLQGLFAWYYRVNVNVKGRSQEKHLR